MKIILGKQIEEIKKKDSEPEKNLLKSRNSEDINELDDDDVYFHSNAVKNIKLGTNIVNRVYLNNSIVYELEDTINSNLFHSLVPSATATSIIFDSIANQDISSYNLIGYCDANNHIAVYRNNTEYLVLNIRNAVIYAPYSCSVFFSNYTALTSCIFDNFDTRYVTNMSKMFRDCNSLTTLDLSSFNTENVTGMFNMFSGCSSLTTLDVSNFKTDNTTDMGWMFLNCSSLTSLDVSKFKTDNVTNMADMFNNCSILTSLDVSNFNTKKVSGMNGMFRDCNSLTTLDLSSFNTENVMSMYLMFSNCSSLTTIISNTFNTTVLNNSVNMFFNCNSLIGSNGTTYKASHINAEYARVDGENGLPGYFTAPAATTK